MKKIIFSLLFFLLFLCVAAGAGADIIVHVGEEKELSHQFDSYTDPDEASWWADSDYVDIKSEVKNGYSYTCTIVGLKEGATTMRFRYAYVTPGGYHYGWHFNIITMQREYSWEWEPGSRTDETTLYNITILTAAAPTPTPTPTPPPTPTPAPLPLSLDGVAANKSSTKTGDAITWTATATGGSGTKSYRFKLYKDGAELLGGTYGTANTYKYTPTQAGTYKVRVYVKDNTDIVTKDSADVIVKTPLTITSVSANKTNPMFGTAITWTAIATGGSGTKTYRFKLFKDGVEFIGGTYSSSDIYKYTPTQSGTYKVRVYVMDSTGTITKDSTNVIVKEPLTITSIKSETSSVIGSAITWTATATGGSGTKSYRFKLYKDGAEFIGGTYSSSSTYKYTPTQSGTYKVRVYVMDSTGTVTMDSSNVIKVMLTITSVTTDRASVTIGSTITWTVTATGGIGSKTYRFIIYKNGEFVSDTWRADNFCKYIPTETGTYKVRTYVTDSTGMVTKDSADVFVNKLLSITSVKADKTSANAGTAITWTAAATGGSGTKNYRFLVYKDGADLTSSKYTTSATFKYTPTAAGTYRVRAYVKDSTGEVSLKSSDVTVKAPLTITSVNTNVTSIDAGSEITWTAAATGGSGTKTYRFKLYKDGAEFIGGTYSSASIYKYTPTEAGIYRARVYVKDNSGTVTKDSIIITVK